MKRLNDGLESARAMAAEAKPDTGAGAPGRGRCSQRSKPRWASRLGKTQHLTKASSASILCRPICTPIGYNTGRRGRTSYKPSRGRGCHGKGRGEGKKPGQATPATTSSTK